MVNPQGSESFDASFALLISRRQPGGEPWSRWDETKSADAGNFGFHWRLFSPSFRFHPVPVRSSAASPKKATSRSLTHRRAARSPLCGWRRSLKLLNSQVALQALVAGEVDVISSGPDLVNARLQNVPVKYIGGSLQRFIFQLWGAKGVGSLPDLKGKIIAVTTPRARATAG